ncbi:DUF3817 domain-containing protein [Parafrankia sp. EUN1f]|uniref:DUF3817 domain-containing protein n=1 Tax=Parafrankia sp. EUN1f TaxID=102897 RepID=UPI0001C449D3|nr:DUF3817 domain-containing protein [Parafrankia sp. EUN1f]EFC85698.1 conserved hypothetical protein [Parafrankia sp. EUN1f]
MTDPSARDGFWPVGATRVVSLAEAISFLLLLVATAIKYGADEPIGVRILGPTHGTLFIAYCLLVLYVSVLRQWKIGRTLLALGASVVPVAPIFVERHWLRPLDASTAAGPGPSGATA